MLRTDNTSNVLDPVEPTDPDPVAGDSTDKPDESRKQYVRNLIKEVKSDEKRWETDFKRMRKNLAFTAGHQWPGQKGIESKRYIANFVNRLVAMKVATLYAKNPKAIATRRKRRDFTLWSGRQEDLLQAGMAMQQSLQMGVPPPPQVVALLKDYENGMDRKEFIKNIGDTFEIVYQYQTDTQEPEFKSQMKQLVWRACVCGVSYVRLSFCREYENTELTVSETRTSVEDRLKTVKGIMAELAKGDLQDSDPRLEELHVLLGSVQQDVAEQKTEVKERLVFDFPNSTSIIPDKHCRSLRDFTGAKRVSEVFIYPLSFVNEFFETDIKLGSGVKTYSPMGMEASAKLDSQATPEKTHVKLYDIIDRDTKTHCIVCDGHDDYVQAPEPLDPSTRRFWPIFALTFNHVETEGECEATPFPPSDVDLMKSAQVEHNRSRNELKKHRIANKPQYVTTAGALSDKDKEDLVGAESSEVIELNTTQEPNKIITPLMKLPIDPAVYDVQAFKEDTLITTGAQEANLGPAQPNVTATVGTIAEQSRNIISSSNVDDLDDILSAMAEAGGEMLLKGMSRETVLRIAGDGAVWPLSNNADFVDEIYLQIQAASSGRPNQAIAVANMERLGPMIMQMVQMPPQLRKPMEALLRETTKRLDENLELDDFLPDPMPLQPNPNLTQSPQMAQPTGPSQPLQQIPSGTSVPLAAA